MQQYIKNYLKAYSYTTADTIYCQRCSKLGQEIHHIQHRQKNNPDLDQAKNLICLCVECHVWIHQNNTYENKQLLLDIIKNILTK